jgi:hypothetical protein
MTTNTKFPSSDNNFSLFANSVIPYLNDNKSRLIITTAAQTALALVTVNLTKADDGWNVVYPLTQIPAKSTSELILKKNQLRESIETNLHIVYNDIPLSLIEPKDSTILGISISPVTRSAVPIPSSVPSITITKHAHLTLDLRIEDTKTKEFLSNVSDAESIEIESAFLPNTTILPAGFPQKSDFRHVVTTGKSKVTLNYDLDQIKGTDYIRARYLNSRKEAGPWSEVVITVVI